MRLRVVASIFLLSATAWAQPSSTDVALATELFNAGRDLVKEGNYAAACPKLAESARLDAKVGTLARLAECEEHIGKLASARARWQQASNLAKATNDNRAAHAESELARIDRIVPKIEIVLSGDAPRDLVLRLDDAELGTGSLGVKLPVDPGKHTIHASAPGKRAASIETETKADGIVSRVVIPALADEASPAPVPAPAPPSPPPPREAPPESTGSSPLRTIGLATAAVGVVGIGVGTVFGVIAKSKRDDSNAQPGGCNGNDCPGPAADTRNDARSAGNVSTVFFVAGAVLAAAGVTMFFVAPSNARAVRIAPVVAKDDARLLFERAW
jgi:hypothetical protein